MEVGDSITVRPSASLRYGKRRGKILGIKTGDLPIQVQFENTVVLYFHPNELLTDEELRLWNSPIFCTVCGKDLSGELVFVCDDCIFRGDMNGSQEDR